MNLFVLAAAKVIVIFKLPNLFKGFFHSFFQSPFQLLLPLRTTNFPLKAVAKIESKMSIASLKAKRKSYKIEAIVLLYEL
jgi:hypothetical protein